MLSADGLGDFASSMCAVGEGPKMRVLGEVAFPHSLGMYYTALTQYLGFWKFGDEYKVMGLAAYGQPEFLEEFRRIVRADRPLSFRLGLEYFTHQSQGADMTWRDATSTPVLGRLFSTYLEKRLGPARKAGRAAHAAAPQSRGQHAGGARRSSHRLLELASRSKAGRRRCAWRAAWLSIASPTGRIFDTTPFEKVYVQPAAGDAGFPWARLSPCTIRFSAARANS